MWSKKVDFSFFEFFGVIVQTTLTLTLLSLQLWYLRFDFELFIRFKHEIIYHNGNKFSFFGTNMKLIWLANFIYFTNTQMNDTKMSSKKKQNEHKDVSKSI